MSESKHESLRQAAKEAVGNLFSDTTVSRETTLDALEELQDEIDVLVQCIYDDLKREGN